MDSTSIKSLRILAKRPEYQFLYNLETQNIKLFVNDIDITEIQYMFLQYLAFYNAIYMDISLKEVDERVLENEIYEDSYMYWRRNRKQDLINRKIDKQAPPTTSQWIFKDSYGKSKH